MNPQHYYSIQDKILPDMLHSCWKIMFKVLKVILSPSQEICFEDLSRWLYVILQAVQAEHIFDLFMLDL